MLPGFSRLGHKGDVINCPIRNQEISQRGDCRRLALRRLERPKKLTQDGVRSRKKFIARGRVPRRAVLALCRGRIRKEPGKENIAKGTPEGRRFGKRRRMNRKCNNGVGNRDASRQLLLREKETFGRMFPEDRADGDPEAKILIFDWANGSE
jgi:hypothetical protein